MNALAWFAVGFMCGMCAVVIALLPSLNVKDRE
jgi:hypothetical protein